MIERKTALIGIGVAVACGALVLFLKNNSGGGSGASASGNAALSGGFSTAGTVYIPTTQETYNYNTYGKGSQISTSTVVNNNQSTATTTYGPITNSPGATIAPVHPVTAVGPVHPVTPIPVHNPVPVPAVPVHVAPPPPPIIKTTSPAKVNIPTSQTNTKPKAPAPVHAAPAPAYHPSAPQWTGALHGGVHYATPRGGWNPGSVVDNLKSHGYSATWNDQVRLAGAMGIQGYKGTAAQNIQMLNTLKAAGK